MGGRIKTPAVPADPEVVSLIAELERSGATVKQGPRATNAQIAAAEKRLGFALPDDYKSFLLSIGGLAIELERTWLFYGLQDALAKTAEYEGVFDDARDGDRDDDDADNDDGDDDGGGDDGSYYPSRFIVLHDEGDYSNAANGMVYDADLNALLFTDGGRYVEASSARRIGYLSYLREQLEEIRNRVDDEDDPLVSGSQRDLDRRRAAKATANKTPPAHPELASAVERLYEVFAAYPRRVLGRRCRQGARCVDCVKRETALNETPLRELTATELSHYAYSYPNRESATGAQRVRIVSDYKHFLPRILELLNEIAHTGSPSVVQEQLLQNIRGLALADEERRAVDAFLAAYWVSLLLEPHPPSAIEHDVEEYLTAAQAFLDMRKLLAAWSAQLSNATAALHAARFVANRELAERAKYVGWNEAPFATLNRWLRAPALRTVLAERAAEEGADPLFKEARDKLEGLANG